MKKLLKYSNSRVDFRLKSGNIARSIRSNSRADFKYKSNLLKSTRSQAATEFLIVLGLAVFFFSIFFLVINQNVSEKYREKEEILVENLALSIQDEINLAVQSSDGYRRQFKIDETLSGNPYYINIIDRNIYIKTERAAISIPVANITGNIKTGLNVIKRENGRVYLN